MWAVLFKYCSPFSSDSHFVLRSRRIWAYLVERLLRKNVCELILNFGQQFREKCHLTHKAPITIAADDKLCDIFTNFRKIKV